MSTNSPRNYNCKDEELPIICGFVALSLKRDLVDFSMYSPLFNDAYVATYEAKITVVEELVQPKSETTEIKLITERIYGTLDGLITPINYVTGYLDLVEDAVPISATDFGLTGLRKSTKSRDVENALKLLRTVMGNIDKYKVELTAKGLTEAMISKFAEAKISLANDKQEKYKLVSNRTAIVQNNLNLLNELNDQLTEICKIGKILYKQTDASKLKDYTFAQLLKQVRRVEKPKEEEKPLEQSEETTVSVK
jgi:hypothetical protein